MKAPLVAVLAILLIIITAMDGHTAASDGSLCQSNGDCASRHCYPGPRGQNYCIHRDWNCAWPGYKGAVFGEVYYFEGTYNFCRTNGLRSYPVDNKDAFLLTRSDLRWEAKPDGIGFSFTCNEDGKRCSASPFSVPGVGNKGSTKQRVREGYVYCNHDMRVLAQNPEKGEYRPRYGIGPVAIDGVTIWYELPSRPPGQGRTWLSLQTFLLSVKRERLESHRESSPCRTP